jgi:hypothetical protein
VPHIESWSGLPAGIREHLAERMRDRNISIDDLNQLWATITSKGRKAHRAPAACAIYGDA